jgi:hypothetical protein
MLSNQDSLKRSLNVKKSKLERFFGSENILELKNDLIEGLKGDKFRENNKNILNNFFKDNPNSNNFLNDFCTWSEDKTKESLKTRFRIATINVILLSIATVLTFFLSPIAGVSVGVISSLACSVAEGVAKRNISNIGHLQQHLGNKIEASTSKMIESRNNPSLNFDAQASLAFLSKPDNYKNKSGIARGLSFFSGFIISNAFNLTNRYSSINFISSPIVMGVIGAFIPFLPLFGYLFSKKSAEYRNKTIQNRKDYFNESVKIFYSSDSQNMSVPNQISSLDQISNSFKEHMRNSDCDGKIISDKGFNKNEKSDNIFNPSKAITLPIWLSSKSHRVINDNILKNENKDLAYYKEYDTHLDASLEFSRQDPDELNLQTTLPSNQNQQDGANKKEINEEESRLVLEDPTPIIISSNPVNLIIGGNSGLPLSSEGRNSPSPVPEINSLTNQLRLNGDDFTAPSNQI